MSKLEVKKLDESLYIIKDINTFKIVEISYPEIKFNSVEEFEEWSESEGFDCANYEIVEWMKKNIIPSWIEPGMKIINTSWDMRTSNPVTVTRDMRLYDHRENMTYNFDAEFDPMDQWTEA